MPGKAGASPDRSARIARIVSLASLVVPLALLAIPGATKPAQAVIAIGGPAIETTITGGPSEGSTIGEESPTFSFTATSDGNPLPGAVFHCTVDDEPTTTCATPFQLEPLEDGAHTFSVYAEDPGAAASDPTPASRSFTVDSGEFAEECAEEGEEEAEAECEEATSPFPPDECLLRTARARLFAYTSRNKVRLVIRYTSLAPAEVSVDYWLKGRKGPLTLGQAKQRFAKKGVFRLTEKLTEAEAEKVRGAKGFMVDLNLPVAPRYCKRFYTRRLTIKRTVHSQVVWFQSDSIFGAGR